MIVAAAEAIPKASRSATKIMRGAMGILLSTIASPGLVRRVLNSILTAWSESKSVALARAGHCTSRRCGHGWRHFAIQPILLVGERRPSFRHAHIALMGGSTFGAFREMQAVLSVFSEQV